MMRNCNELRGSFLHFGGMERRDRAPVLRDDRAIRGGQVAGLAEDRWHGGCARFLAAGFGITLSLPGFGRGNAEKGLGIFPVRSFAYGK
jgi:hypothetical protein